MKTLLLCLTLVAGCDHAAGVLTSAIDVVDAGASDAGGMGAPCDPNACSNVCVDPPGCTSYRTACPMCNDGLTCTVDGICDGPVCSNYGGNVVCHDPMVCAINQGNCDPPCYVNGAPVFKRPGNCEGRGLLTAPDGRCFAPCFWEICGPDGWGGTCPTPLP